MENGRTEAYRNYMSDSLVLINTFLTRGEVTIPRYADMIKDHDDQPQQETAEQVISRFDKLRRAT